MDHVPDRLGSDHDRHCALVRNQAVAVGASGWLDRLSGLVEDVVRDWNLTLGEVYHEATEAFVANVTLADGTPAVLKVGIPHPGDRANREITVLRLTGGDGCVRLLRHDIARGAPCWNGSAPPSCELGALPRRLKSSPTRGGCGDRRRRGLPTGADRARWLAEVLVANWEERSPLLRAGGGATLVCAKRRIAHSTGGRCWCTGRPPAQRVGVRRWVPAGGPRRCWPDPSTTWRTDAEIRWNCWRATRTPGAVAGGGAGWTRARLEWGCWAGGYRLLCTGSTSSRSAGTCC